MGIVLVLAALAANSVVAYRAIGAAVRHNESVVHTLELIGELETTFSVVKDAETGQRGFLLTRNPAYLEPYNDALAKVPARVDRIDKLTKADPEQQRSIPMLRQLIQERLALLKRTLEYAQRGDYRSVARALNLGLGRQKMDQLRKLIAGMMQRENQRLVEQTAVSKKSLQEGSVAFLLASLVAVLFVLAFFLGAKSDLAEKAQASAAVRESEAWLRTTLHSIGDAVIATNDKGEVQFINGVAERLLRYSNPEVQGKPLSQVFPIFNEITGAPATNPVALAIEKGAVVGLANHSVLRNHEGEEFAIEDSAAPIMDPAGKVSGVVLVFRDVTQQRRARENAKTAEKLAAAGRLAATIAHEVNNPLEAATNLLYLAHTAPSLKETRRYVAAAEHELSRMAHITRKTLTFYRASSVPLPTHLVALFAEVLTIYGNQLRSKQIKVEIQCPDDLKINTLRGDLTQVLSNLVSNALDAMDTAGQLTIRAAREQGGVRLEVEDNGSGIPAEHLDKVFEPFFTTKRNTGTGLGLWVVKDLVEQQGGTISVVSYAEGAQRGARFLLFLPSLPADSVPEQQITAS